ncbi:MAG: HAD family phosphatase [Ruminococcus sp.]|nr:HAD family phosphatase [Ruminococcus sp.]
MNIIFFDIDGTLITEDDYMIIPESTVKALKMTREKGNITFINTGRTKFNVSKKIRSLGFDGIICGCGTYIEYKGEVLEYASLSQDLCRKIVDIMRKCRVVPVYEHKDGYFFDEKAETSQDLEHFKEFFVEDGIRTDRQAEDPDFIFDKFVIWETENSDMNLFRKETEKYFRIIDRGNGFFENVPIGYSKATAIDKILKILNIPKENAYAIGDSTNDLPMLKAVPNSIAMGGAEKLYPYVSYITDPILDDGLYNALEHFKLI